MTKTECMASNWKDLSRWQGIKRPYTPEDVLRLRGSIKIEHTLADLGAKRFWQLLEEKPYINALGALTGNQAVQQVQAGLLAIYLSGWQVAADANDACQMYPDQSIYPSNSVPQVVRRINNALLRADQIDQSKSGIHWFAPIIADAEAGFGGVVNVFELMKQMIDAGASAVHFEDQLSSAKKCGHTGGKCVIPTSEFINKLIAARLAADVCGVPTVLIGRTDANSAGLLANDIDEYDAPFIDKSKQRTSEGYFYFNGGLDAAIARGLAYAPYCDIIWCETAHPDLEEAKQFAEAIYEKFPQKKLGYNCFSRNTQFITNSGVKSFEEFKDGDETVVLTHTGNWQKAKIKCYGEQSLNKVTFSLGKRKNIHTQQVFATQDHRWLVVGSNKQMKETTNLKIGDKLLKSQHIATFNYEKAEPFEKLYWCYGYVYGDGTINGKGTKNATSMVRLCKKDMNYAPRFEEMCFSTSTSLSLQGDYMAYTGKYLKTLPDVNKDPVNLLSAFLAGFLDADSRKVVNSNGRRHKWIQVTGKEEVDFLEKMLPLSGHYVTHKTYLTDEVTDYGPRSDITIRFHLSVSKPKYSCNWSVKNIETNVTKENVWCLEVENDHSFVMPNGIVTGNCSPSFNWTKYLDDTTIAKFQRELGAMGYKFQFITLAGFHALNFSMFELARKYKAEQMTAYVKLQEKEFKHQEFGYSATKHQTFVGTEYFDDVMNVITGGTELSAMKGSTEKEQFNH